jgi:hypothetical protein
VGGALGGQDDDHACGAAACHEVAGQRGELLPVGQEDATASGPERRALSGSAPPSSRAPEDRFQSLRRNDLRDPPLSAGDLCRPSGPNGEGQARGQARWARGESPGDATYRLIQGVNNQ